METEVNRTFAEIGIFAEFTCSGYTYQKMSRVRAVTVDTLETQGGISEYFAPNVKVRSIEDVEVSR